MECQILLVSRHFKAKPARQPAKFPTRRASGHRRLKFQQTVPKLTFSKAHSRMTHSAARERRSSGKPSKIFHNQILHPNGRSGSLQLLPIYGTTAWYHRRGGFTKPSSPANREPTRRRRGGTAWKLTSHRCGLPPFRIGLTSAPSRQSPRCCTASRRACATPCYSRCGRALQNSSPRHSR